MKILVVSNMFPNKEHPYFGTFVKNFCDLLVELSVEVEMVVMHKSKNVLDKFVGYLAYYVKIIFKILFQEYDLVYVHYGSLNAPPILFASLFKKVKIYTNLHGSDVQSETLLNKLLQPYQKKLLATSHRVVVPSKTFGKIVIDKYDILDDKLVQYPSSGVDSCIFSQRELSMLQIGNVELRKGEFIFVGFVGRIETSKGWAVLIEAINHIVNHLKIRNIKCIIVGSGSESNMLLQKVRQYNLEDYIYRTDALAQQSLVNVYSFMDCLIFPSYRESLGLVPIEALSCGTPVIASDIEVTHEYIFEGENGFFFQSGNSLDLADKILKYKNLGIEDKMFLQLKAVEIAKKFSKESTKKKLKDIITRL